MHRDPVCKRKINPNKAYVAIDHNGITYYLCCPLCQREFEHDPKRFIRELHAKHPEHRKGHT
jgi:YHS domain-containing protein